MFRELLLMLHLLRAAESRVALLLQVSELASGVVHPQAMGFGVEQCRETKGEGGCVLAMFLPCFLFFWLALGPFVDLICSVFDPHEGYKGSKKVTGSW